MSGVRQTFAIQHRLSELFRPGSHCFQTNLGPIPHTHDHRRHKSAKSHQYERANQHAEALRGEANVL